MLIGVVEKVVYIIMYIYIGRYIGRYINVYIYIYIYVCICICIYIRYIDDLVEVGDGVEVQAGVGGDAEARAQPHRVISAYLGPLST